MQPPIRPGPAGRLQRLPGAAAQPLLCVAELRAIEAQALAQGDPTRFMRQAGAALARLALAIAPHAARVRVECGPGHNGGDGLMAAAALAAAGRRVEILPAFDLTRIPALPSSVQVAWAEARAAGCTLLLHAPGPDDEDTRVLAVDALLGIGARSAPGGTVLQAVQRLNRHAGPVLAADLPTGLDADTGAVPGEAVRAHHTLSFIAGKPGLFTGQGRDHAGQVWIDDLGLHRPESGSAAVRLGGLAALTARDRHSDHKGSRGDVIVLGGAPGMEGAADLAARAAHASGAGRVWRVTLGDGVPSTRPELMHLPVAQALESGRLGRSTVVAGCGGGSPIVGWLGTVLAQASRLVIDADGLNALATEPALARGLVRRSTCGRPTVLTPHPLEAARLLGCGTDEVQGDRPRAARELARRFGAVVVLKGSGTLIARPDGSITINPTGGPALASAGTGDVLAGWIGGLWAGAPARPVSPAQGQADAFLAAEEACRLHGAAGEAVARGPLRAADLIEAMWAARTAVGA